MIWIVVVLVTTPVLVPLIAAMVVPVGSPADGDVFIDLVCGERVR